MTTEFGALLAICVCIISVVCRLLCVLSKEFRKAVFTYCSGAVSFVTVVTSILICRVIGLTRESVCILVCSIILALAVSKDRDVCVNGRTLNPLEEESGRR